MNVRAPIAYAGRGIQRPRYHANDASRDQLEIVAVDMDIADGRSLGVKLEQTGFELVGHRSALADFGDRAAVDAVYRPEVIERRIGRRCSECNRFQIESIVAPTFSWSMIFSNLRSPIEAGFAKAGNRFPPSDQIRAQAFFGLCFRRSH